MSDVSTMLSLLEKLQKMDDLAKKVKELEEGMKGLKHEVEELRKERVISQSLSSASSPDEKSKVAADWAIEHFRRVPPTRR